MGYRPWGHKESDTTEVTKHEFNSNSCINREIKCDRKYHSNILERLIVDYNRHGNEKHKIRTVVILGRNDLLIS